MSFQIVCDNCGAYVELDKPTGTYIPLPSGWEIVVGKKVNGVGAHHCPECVRVSNQARWNAEAEIRKAQEAALAARRTPEQKVRMGYD